MEYFNQTSSDYFYYLENDNNNYKIKLEILIFYETVIGEIIKDIPTTAQGQININYQQITRRSCSLSLINVDKQYTPNQNRWFWENRKFKLWVGVELSATKDTYWFSQGVFYTNNAICDGHLLNIDGVDKGANLDGTLRTNMLDGNYVVEKGSTITNLVKNTLLLSDGVFPIDPIPPLIDTKFNRTKIQADITINDGEYIGKLFTDIGNSYGTDVFYDTEGRLNLINSVENNGTDGYLYMGSQYHFKDVNANYNASSVQYSYDCVNAVTVFTNISAKDNDGNNIENVSYTAYNTNPLSPLNIKAIGIRRMDSVEVAYIDNLSPQKMKQRCKEYAEYLLKRKSLQQLAISFNSIVVPHLDVNNVVTITDESKELNAEKFIIQSITIPLSAGEMNIQAASVTSMPKFTRIGNEVRS